MADPTTTRDWIIQLIQVEWELRIGKPTLAQTVFDNDPAALVDSGVRARLTILFGARPAKSLGGATTVYRQSGTIMVQVFADPNIGPSKVQTVFSKVDENFRSRRMTAGDSAATVVRFRIPEQNLLGILDGAYRMNVVLPFWFDEFLANANP